MFGTLESASVGAVGAVVALGAAAVVVDLLTSCCCRHHTGKTALSVNTATPIILSL